MNISLFENCIFDGKLNDYLYEEKILNMLPKDFIYEHKVGASKLVIIPNGTKYVFKIPFNSAYKTTHKFHLANNDEKRNWDYCLAESLVYIHAKQANLHSLFAPERMVGIINDHPIYIQQKAVTLEDFEGDFSDLPRDKSIEMQQEVGYAFNSRWLAAAIKWYGENRVRRLLFFLSDNELCDFHEKNIGFIGNRPVLIDYSSFWD